MTKRRAKREEGRARTIIAIVIVVLALSTTHYALRTTPASANVDPVSPNHWAWNDIAKWIDFYNTSDTVTLTANTLQGYASSSIGYISFDCATSPAGNICSAANGNYKVSNDGSGNLSGWAWNDAYGWISFCGGQSATDCPGTEPYRVLVDTGTGTFCDGASLDLCYAWNDALGWISFNCLVHESDDALPCVVDYNVDTSWSASTATGTLESVTFDTGVPGGAAFHSVIAHYTLPSPVDGAAVAFQVAVSNSSSGPWSYGGPGGSAALWYEPVAAGTPVTLDYDVRGRYFRYKVQLTSNLAQTRSPLFDDVNVVWSR